jgi:hypothetical protein
MRYVRELIYRIKTLPVLESLGTGTHKGVYYSDHATSWKTKEVGVRVPAKREFASLVPQAYPNSCSTVLASDERAFSLKTARV